LPEIPRTTRTTSEAEFLGGMKSMSTATPVGVSKVVSRMSVPDRYWRRLDQTPSGAISQRPCSALPSKAAKHAGESNRGQQSQSIEPPRLTSAAVSPSPMIA
jgi:hypothetical protein